MIHDQINTLPGSGYHKRSLMGLKYVIIHHSASDNDSVESINDYHISKGWPRIGYHFVIDRNGEIHKTNPVDVRSWHCTGQNNVSIGICVLGDFENRHPDPDQLNALDWLLKHILGSPLLPDLEVKGHRDFKNTLCPGSKLYHELFG